jgi:hypothetical protein
VDGDDDGDVIGISFCGFSFARQSNKKTSPTCADQNNSNKIFSINQSIKIRNNFLRNHRCTNNHVGKIENGGHYLLSIFFFFGHSPDFFRCQQQKLLSLVSL